MAQLISDDGLPETNSYASIEFANDYWDTSPYSATWDDASDDDKIRALITASRQLDTWFEWKGAISDLNQGLLWPRTGVLRPGVARDQGTVSLQTDWGVPFGGMLDPDVVPVIIRQATCEYAGQLLVSNRMADSDIETQGINSVNAGPVSITFKSGVEAKPVPDAVMVMCSQLGYPRGKSGFGSGGVNILRG
jgi:hypothetical protein